MQFKGERADQSRKSMYHETDRQSQATETKDKSGLRLEKKTKRRGAPDLHKPQHIA